MISAFNQPDHIGDAILAAVHQTQPFFQILVIDDHSTDATLDVIHALMAEYPQIELITKDANQGVSHSRNIARDAVRGDYIWFTDGDDIIERDAHEELQTLLGDGQPDMAVVGFRMKLAVENPNEVRNKIVTFDPSLLEFDRADTPSQIAKIINYPPPAWLKVCRVSFLKENDIFFEDYVMEDILWHFKAILCAETFHCTSKILINYRIHEASAMRQSDKAVIGVLDLWKAVGSLLEEHECLSPEINDAYERLQFRHLTSFALHNGRIPEQYLPEYARNILPRLEKQPNLVTDQEFAALEDIRKIGAKAH